MKKSNCKYSFIDPNDNISVFDYSPLGLLKATAVIGKGTEGDYKSNTGGFYERYAPSAWMEYDFFAFKNTGNPVWVKTTQREQHWQQDPNPNSPTLIKVEYSDGFGRLLQTRTQAEDVIFGDATFGSSGLNPVQGQPNDPATGTERAPSSPLNVVVSGWQIYNNKGKVVEQYEPFFDKGFDYQLPGTSGVKIIMYYDPLQRVVRTVNPDKSEQRVYFGKPKHLNNLSGSLPYDPTPWESFAYDANDLASITGGGNVSTTDYFTPKSSEIDALGRTIRTTEYWNNSDYSDTIVMRYRYDIRGNLLQVKDPYGRTVFEHVYDLANQPLRNYHIDSGVSHALTDATGKPIEASDAKSARTLSAFDTLQRPTHVWAQNNSSDSLRLTIYSLYGEAAVNPKTLNLLGKPWQVYDESGKTESAGFDFKGNLLFKKQQVIDNAVLKTALDNYQAYLVNWTGLPAILSTQIFETSSEYDALNRVVKIILPENVNNERKEIVPAYNRAGALEQVRYDGTVYVENIAYNAKGQRLLIAFGNDIMTRYVYQPTTFRLIRQRSEKFTKTHTGNTITYTTVSGTSRQDDGFNFDLVGNILKILTRVSDCGITGSSLGSDALDKVFTYNSVYRLTSATGRESNTQHENDYLYADAPVPGSPNANHVKAYTREYDYDKLGNVLQVKQTGNNAFTRNFSYHTGKNTLEKVETGSAALIEDFTYDSCGNQLTAGASRNYVWNAANQLITYYNQAGSADPTIFAQYDYAGQERVSKIVRTGTNANPVYERTIYIDGIFEYHLLENGTTYEKNYVHIMDDRSRIAMVRVGDQFPDDINEAITYNLENQIGSSTIRLTETGTIIDKEEYYPFGDSSLRTFSKKRYRYVGREKDLENGLYYYGARYYCAWTCRFISVDPLAAQYEQLTPYNYADNNPVNDYDIDGMQDNESKNGVKDATPTTGSLDNGAESDDKGNSGNKTIHFIEYQSGNYLCTIGDINSKDYEVRSITFENFDKNNVDTIGYESISNISNLVEVDRDKIFEDFKELVSQASLNGEKKEQSMVIYYDRENQKISSIVQPHNANDEYTSTGEYSDFVSFSTLGGKPSWIILGQIHTHIDVSEPLIKMSETGTSTIIQHQEKPNERGRALNSPGVSIGEKFDTGFAIRRSAPVYALALFNSKGSIYKASATGEPNSPRNNKEYTNIDDVLGLRFDLIKDVILSKNIIIRPY